MIGLVDKIMPHWSLPSELECVGSKGRLQRLRRYFRWRLPAQVAATQLPTTVDASLYQVDAISRLGHQSKTVSPYRLSPGTRLCKI